MTVGVVGREGELAAAQAFLAEVPGGSRGLLVEGEPGIGKTAVWRAVVGEASAVGYRVLSCVGGQAEARLSFVGLGDLLAEIGEAELRALPRPQREALERALVRRGGAGRAADAKAIGMGLHSLVAGFAQSAPVLLAIDDVQWLDGATAFALAFLVRRLARLRVGVLVTVRIPLSAPDPLALERGLGGDRLTRLRLGPLSLGALRLLMEMRLGYRYPRPVLQRIVHVSDGNPLFALEIAGALGPAPALEPGAPLPVADSLRELVAERVAAVPPAGRQALLASAALASPRVDLVERASSASGLAAAAEAGLLRVEGERVSFLHPLYAAAVYREAAGRRRRGLHKRLARLVEDPEERARHLALATAVPDERIGEALEGAAGHARSRGAWDAAGELLELAKALTPPTQQDAVRRRGARAAEHYIHAGDRPRARALLEQLLAETPAGPPRSDMLRLLAEIYFEEDGFAHATGLLEEALEHAEDTAVRGGIYLGLAFSRCRLADFAGADGYVARALDEAARCPDQGLLAEALAMRAMVDYLLGRGIEWSTVERSLALEDTERLLPLQMRPSLIAALLTLYAGRLADARQRLARLLGAASDAGDESDLASLLLWLAHLETLSGSFDEAERLAEAAAVNAELTGSEAQRAWAVAQRAHLHAHRGQVAEARDAAAEAVGSCERHGFWLPLLWVSSALSLLELSLGDAPAAWRAVQAFTESVEAQGVGEPDIHRFLPAALEALIALGELDRAERLLERFELRAREVDRVWALATGGRCRGLLLAARGDLDGAERALDLALAEHVQIEMPFELARTLLVLGRLRRRRRARRAAREPLEQALALFEGMGARVWAEQARTELERLGRRSEAGKLTAAESRVIALAAAGRANKQIAAELFVSVHTVELHLSHAYAKLGVRSRRELAGRLARDER